MYNVMEVLYVMVRTTCGTKTVTKVLFYESIRTQIGHRQVPVRFAI